MVSCAIILFWIGFFCGKWDAKHGAEAGFRHGTWLRVNILRLPPVERDENASQQ